MPKLKPETIIPAPQEEARIQAGIDADPDAYSLSDENGRKLNQCPHWPAKG